MLFVFQATQPVIRFPYLSPPASQEIDDEIEDTINETNQRLIEIIDEDDEIEDISDNEEAGKANFATAVNNHIAQHKM